MAVFRVDIRLTCSLSAPIREVLTTELSSETHSASCGIPAPDRTGELPRSPML